MFDFEIIPPLIAQGLAFGIMATVLYWAYVTSKAWRQLRPNMEMSDAEFWRTSIAQLFQQRGFRTLLILATSLGVLLACLLNLATRT